MEASTEKVKNKGGRQWDLTPMLVDHIVSNVPNAYFIKPVAILSGVAENNLSRWLIRGEKEFSEGLDTICADLFVRFYAAKYEESKEILVRLKECPKNYGALTFILERCFKGQFEQKSEMQKKLEDIVFNQIAPMLGKGDIDGRKESDAEDEVSSR